MSAPQEPNTGTSVAMGKVEYSRAQYRKLFELFCPKHLRVIDDFLETFGRENIKALKVYCNVPKVRAVHKS